MHKLLMSVHANMASGTTTILGNGYQTVTALSLLAPLLRLVIVISDHVCHVHSLTLTHVYNRLMNSVARMKKTAVYRWGLDYMLF